MLYQLSISIYLLIFEWIILFSLNKECFLIIIKNKLKKKYRKKLLIVNKQC